MDKDDDLNIAYDSKRIGATQLPLEEESIHNLWFIHTI